MVGGHWNGIRRGEKVTVQGEQGLFTFYRFNTQTMRVELFDPNGGVWELSVGDAYEKIRRA